MKAISFFSFLLGFAVAMTWFVFTSVPKTELWRNCESSGYHNLNVIKRIKCTVEKLEWEKAE